MKVQLKQVKTQLELVRNFNVGSPFNNFPKKKFSENEPKFNGVYSRNNLPKIRDGAYLTNLDEFKLIGTHWIALYVNRRNATYLDSFGVKHIPKEIKKPLGNKNIITNICRIQTHDSIMSGCFCIEFIDFMLEDKSLLD